MILNQKVFRGEYRGRRAEPDALRARGARARAYRVLKSKFTMPERVSPPIVTHGAISTPCTTSLRIPEAQSSQIAVIHYT